MENSVLGNALEGVPVEEAEEEDVEKPKDSNAETLDGEQTGFLLQLTACWSLVTLSLSLSLTVREDQRRAEGSGI